jgi:hypothetical protein
VVCLTCLLCVCNCFVFRNSIILLFTVAFISHSIHKMSRIYGAVFRKTYSQVIRIICVMCIGVIFSVSHGGKCDVVKHM